MAIARDNFTIYVDKNFTRVSFSGGDLSPVPEGITRISVKKTDTIPKDILGDLLKFNRDWIEINSITKEDLSLFSPPPPILPRKYTAEGLRIYIESMPKGQSDDELRKILKDEFHIISKVTSIGRLINNILEEQEKVRRGD